MTVEEYHQTLKRMQKLRELQYQAWLEFDLETMLVKQVVIPEDRPTDSD